MQNNDVWRGGFRMRTVCWRVYSYLDLSERNYYEDGENCIMRAFIIYAGEIM
jgi:hypothetical protein